MRAEDLHEDLPVLVPLRASVLRAEPYRLKISTFQVRRGLVELSGVVLGLDGQPIRRIADNKPIHRTDTVFLERLAPMRTRGRLWRRVEEAADLAHAHGFEVSGLDLIDMSGTFTLTLKRGGEEIDIIYELGPWTGLLRLRHAMARQGGSARAYARWKSVQTRITRQGVDITKH